MRRILYIALMLAIGLTVSSASTDESPMEFPLLDETISICSVCDVEEIETISLDPEDYITYYNIPLSHELQRYSWDMSTKYMIPYELLLAVMYAESGFNEVCDTGKCHGLMQIHEVNYASLYEGLGLKDIDKDPMANIEAGAYILSNYIRMCEGDLDKVLMAYNCGYWGAKRKWEAGQTSSNYSQKVQNYMFKLYDGELSMLNWT